MDCEENLGAVARAISIEAGHAMKVTDLYRKRKRGNQADGEEDKSDKQFSF
jgi:hypothetical protein